MFYFKNSQIIRFTESKVSFQLSLLSLHTQVRNEVSQICVRVFRVMAQRIITGGQMCYLLCPIFMVLKREFMNLGVR